MTNSPKNTENTDDQKLLGNIANGCRKSFASFYEKNANLVFGVLMRILRDRIEAEEIMQEVFVRVWTKASRFDPALASERTWLIALTRNAAIDRLRSGKRRPPTEEIDPETVSDAPTPENAAWNSQIASGLDHCLSQLDPSKASYVRLAYLEGWSYEELARASGTPVNTMKTWLRRSLLRLRDCLAGLGMRHD